MDRTQPVLPLAPGVPERRTHDYRRHGIIAKRNSVELARRAATDFLEICDWYLPTIAEGRDPAEVEP